MASTPKMASSSKRLHGDENDVSCEESGQSESESDVENDTTINKNPKKFGGSFSYKVKFKAEWKQLYPVKEVARDEYKFYCLPCGKTLTCHHQGLGDIKKHCTNDSHKTALKSWKKQKTLSFCTDNKQDVFQNNVTRAEVIVSNFLVQHNLPLATSDHLGPLFRNAFPDSKIASAYSSARTKTTAIVNETFGSHCHEFIVKHCQNHPFSCGTDGSSDTGIQKMNPVSIRIFDINSAKKVSIHFYNMCLTEGEDGAKAKAIFEAIDENFTKDKLPYENCVSLSVDNTSTMVGKNNSVASRFKQKNPEIFISGCPCHLAHIAASHANDAFSEILGLNVENLCIDLYYWFDKSSKRKGKLKEYFDFCDQEYMGVLKHISVRWLSLQQCMERILKKLPSLKSYFLSEEWADERFQRLRGWFENPLLEPALLFQTNAISMFTNFNMLLQRDEPSIHLLKPAMESLKIPVLQESPSAFHVNLNDNSVYKDDTSIFLGMTTRATLNRLLSQGDISDDDFKKFHTAVHSYFKDSLIYMKTKFPINDKTISNSVWIDTTQRSEVSWENVQYFVDKYSAVLSLKGVNEDKLYDEFADYQLLSTDDFPKGAFDDAKVIDGNVDGEEVYHYRMDTLWWHISRMEIPQTSIKRFKFLPTVAEIVLLIPHSNAELERLFSIVRKNKTDARSSLKLDGTLSSILAMKSRYPESHIPCHKFKPDEEMIKSAKSATSKVLANKSK